MVRTNTRLGWVLAPVLAGALTVGCGSDDPAPEPQPGEQPRASVDPLAKLAAAEARPIVLDGRPVVLTGSPGGAYYELARTLKVAGEEREPALIPTTGSLETLQLLAFGRGDLGLVQGDVLTAPALRSLRAALAETAAPAFNEEVFVLVGSNTSKLIDLAGAKVGVGAAGSGSATTAANLFWAAGVYDVELVPGNYADHLRAVAAGELAAAVVVGGQPLLALRDAGLKALDLGEERDAILAELQKTYAGYAAGEIAAASGGPAQTIAVPAFVVRRSGFAGEIDLSAARDALHPKAQGVTSASADLPTSGDGPSLVVREAEAPVRLAGEDAGAIGLVARAWSSGGAPVQTARADALTALALLSAGQAEAAVVQEDLLLEALARPASARVLARYQVAAFLFPVDLHLVQPAGGPVNDAASLRGKDKHLVIGTPASSLGASARRILRLFRVLPEHYVGHLAPAPGALAQVHPGAPADGEAAVALGELAGYQSLETGGVRTRAVLVVRRELPSEQVQALVAALYANRKNLAGQDERFGGLDPEQLGALPEGLTLHAGAVAAREAGLQPDSADPWE